MNQLGIWGLAGVLCHFLRRAVNPCKANFSFCTHVDCLLDYPGDSDGKASVYNVGDLGLIPGSGRFPGEGNGTPLQYSCLENPMDGGAWCRLLSMGHKELDMTEQLHSLTVSMVSLTPYLVLQRILHPSFTVIHIQRLEKETATHTTILAWRIPWAEEPSRLQSMGSQESDTT